jgi:hypothetical protein
MGIFLYAYRRWRETGLERRESLWWRRRSSMEAMAGVGVRQSRGDGRRELRARWGKNKIKQGKMLSGKRGKWEKGES